jgi:hypothetical protein
MEPLSLVSDLLSLTSAVFAAAAWMQVRASRRAVEAEAERQRAIISFALWSDETQSSTMLPMTLRRSDLSRAEVLGVLGMVPMRQKGARFSLKYVGTPAFLAALNAAKDDSTPMLFRIPATQAEIEQFDI